MQFQMKQAWMRQVARVLATGMAASAVCLFIGASPYIAPRAAAASPSPAQSPHSPDKSGTHNSGRDFVTGPKALAEKSASADTVSQPLQVYGIGSVFAVAFSPDGHHILLGAAANAYLYNADTYERERVFIGHMGYVTSVAFSPDGTKVLTGAGDQHLLDNTAKLWDAATGAEIRTFTGHKASVESATFSPDGTKVLTGSGDGTARLWQTTVVSTRRSRHSRSP